MVCGLFSPRHISWPSRRRLLLARRWGRRRKPKKRRPERNWPKHTDGSVFLSTAAHLFAFTIHVEIFKQSILKSYINKYYSKVGGRRGGGTKRKRNSWVCIQTPKMSLLFFNAISFLTVNACSFVHFSTVASEYRKWEDRPSIMLWIYNHCPLWSYNAH